MKSGRPSLTRTYPAKRLQKRRAQFSFEARVYPASRARKPPLPRLHTTSPPRAYISTASRGHLPCTPHELDRLNDVLYGYSVVYLATLVPNDRGARNV